MNRRRLNQFKLNVSQLNTFVLNAKGIKEKMPSGSSADISQAIMDSLVCWYDIGKQQCTNESMAANPVLADLSGNGHDITCYNFGWAGMSGIGGYMSDFTKGYHYPDTKDESFDYITPTKFHFIKAFNISGDIWKLKYIGGKIKLNITGIPDDANFRIGTLSNVINLQNGINILDISSVVDADSTYGFSLSRTGECNITVEQLPLYPNALVSDGVDDYCYTDGLPILMDYTVIAKRKILADAVSALVSKASDNNSTDGAFIFDAKNGGGYIACNFGANNALDELYSGDISYQTKESYNGISIIKLNHVDTDKLSLFTFSAQKNLVNQYALYSFLLFDRTLTTAEIEWVKKNMIESGGVLATNWADSSLWAFRNGLNGTDKRIIGTVTAVKMNITSCLNINNFMEVSVENITTPAYTIKVT